MVLIMDKRTIARQTVAISVFVAVVLCSFVSQTECQTSPPPPPPLPACATYRECDSCVKHARCLWCFTTNNCTEYPVSWLLPPASVCELSQARWGVCWVNFEALIIGMAVVGGALLISIIVCCCCCCGCCKSRPSGPDRDDERLSRKREEIRQRSDDRKVERKARHDEIRKKYGLITDSDHPYSKFENE